MFGGCGVVLCGMVDVVWYVWCGWMDGGWAESIAEGDETLLYIYPFFPLLASCPSSPSPHLAVPWVPMVGWMDGWDAMRRTNGQTNEGAGGRMDEWVQQTPR